MKIMVCYDGTVVAEKALETAIDLGIQSDGEIYILTSISHKDEPKEVFEFIKNDTEKEIEIRKKQIDEACGIVKRTGLECHTHISNRGKRTGEDIVDAARQMNVEYIVIGVRKRSRVDKMIFGSNVQYVVLNSPCPVVTINE